MMLRRKFNNEEFHDSYCLPNDRNEVDGTYSINVVEQKNFNNLI